MTWHPLDITDWSSISKFASSVSKSHPNGIDALINNAGLNLDTDNPPGLSISTRTLKTNYYGTLAVTQALLSLLSGPTAPELGKRRIVNVSSVGSTSLSPAKKKELAACSTLDQIEKFGDTYLKAVADERVAEEDWPVGKSYSVSKAMLNSATSVMAREHANVLVNACCPGWCSTDTGKLTGATPPKTPQEGARVPLRLAFGDLGGVSGKYWENESVTSKGEGNPSDWTR